jgi:hypothetical protein
MSKRISCITKLLLAACVPLLIPPLPCFSQSTTASPDHFSAQNLAAPMLRDPIFVYNNWSSYDELSDNVPLTEELAMRELDQIIRLKKFGIRFDYYLMDAFWYAPDGAYRTWRKPNWPNGPDRWIQKCKENGIQPGLWFSSNTLVKIDAAPQWRDSLSKNGWQMSFFEGGFLPDFMNVLQYWYDHGIRAFKFDFVELAAATPEDETKLTKDEIRRRNGDALRAALQKFRERNKDVILEAFNGFGGDLDSTSSPFPFHDPVDLRWLDVFDIQYTGDPRPSDVPEMNFWRSMDIYGDHMVRRFEQSHFPAERIDSTSFMIGKTGTIYYRGMNAWKGALILMMARGGWINTVHGNLELIGDDDARWFARVQSLFLGLQSLGRTKAFGGIPGEVQTYGFGSVDADGSIYVVVNPAQSMQSIQMPLLSQEQRPLASGRLLFADAGFRPVLAGNKIQLGPGQMAMVYFGKYSLPKYDFGIQQDVVIPKTIRPVDAQFQTTGKGVIEATISPPAGGDLRLVMQQHNPDGSIRRTWAGGPPKGTNMGQVFLLEATQNGRTLPVTINYDKVIWSGLSWAVGEIKRKDLQPGAPITLRFTSKEKDPVTLTGNVYQVTY